MAVLLQPQMRPEHEVYPRDCHRRDDQAALLRLLRQRQRLRLTQDHWPTEPQPLQPQPPAPALQMQVQPVEADTPWRAEVEDGTWRMDQSEGMNE